jgi:hypothetical protein
LAASLALLAVGVSSVAVLGPLVFDVIEFHLVDDVLNQVMGGDAVALVLVAPTAAFAAWLLWRGQAAGPVVALAPAGYAMYTYPQLALGGEFATEPGNSERFFPLYLAIFMLAAASFVTAWNRVDPAAQPTPTGRLRRTVIGVLITLSVFLTVGLHLPGLVDIVGGAPFEVEYTQSPTVFLIVKLMDLGIVVPVMVVTAAGLWRQAAWANRLMYVMVGWGALLGSAVAGMGAVMVANDDPAASAGITVGFVIGAFALLTLAVRLFAPLFEPAPPPEDHDVRMALAHHRHPAPELGRHNERV